MSLGTEEFFLGNGEIDFVTVLHSEVQSHPFGNSTLSSSAFCSIRLGYELLFSQNLFNRTKQQKFSFFNIPILHRALRI